jgi:hypothetical protein
MPLPQFTALLLAWALSAFTAQGQSLPEALDTPELTWQAGGQALWQVKPTTTGLKGASVAQLGPFTLAPADPGPDVSGWLLTTVTGPGLFRVFVKTTRTPNITVTLSRTGAEGDLSGIHADTSNPIYWTPLTITIPAGTHEIRLQGSFRYRPDGYYYVQPVLQADSAIFYPSLPTTGVAMDAPHLTWFTAGEPGFTPVTENTHDGMDALHAAVQSGASRLETHLTGPTTVSWWRRGKAALTITGNPVENEASPDWIQEKFFLPAGSQWLRWNIPERSVDSITLDEFKSVPAAGTTLADALDSPGILFTSNAWQAHRTSAASDGIDHAWVNPDVGQPAWIQAFVTGPALVSFRHGGLGGNLLLSVHVDGIEVNRFYPGSNSDSFIVPAGNHTVQWITDVSLFRNNSPVYTLDQVSVTPLPASSVTAALDDGSLTWRFPGSTPWSSALSTAAHDQNHFAYSPVVQGGSSILETTVSGPGTLSFWWSSKTGYSQSTFRIPGTPLTLSVPQEWQQQILELPPGTHTCQWLVEGNAGAGAILLDQVSWTPASLPPAADALDLEPRLLAFGGTAANRDPDIHSDGEDSLRITVPPGSYSASLTLWIQGPARLDCRVRTPDGQFSHSSVDPSQEWHTVSQVIQPGLIPVNFTHNRGSVPLDLPTSSWLDAVTITPLARSLAEGLTAPGFEWRTNPDNPWSGMVSSLQTLPLFAAPGPFGPANPPSWLETTVTGPAVASFLRLGSFNITLNGTGSSYGQPSSYSAERGTLWIPPGQHTLRWQQDGAATGNPPSLSNFKLHSCNGVPTLNREQNQFLLTIPRPAGFADAQIRIQQADFKASSFFKDLNPQPAIAASTPDKITYRLSPAAAPGSRLFWRAAFR